VEEYHVDGFRFDLASALCRDPLGKPIPGPPLIRQIAKDPVLSKARRPSRSDARADASDARADASDARADMRSSALLWSPHSLGVAGLEPLARLAPCQ